MQTTTREGSAARRLMLAAVVAAALLSLLPAVAHADVTFQPPVAYAAQDGTQDVATGDFNKDGKPDVATANETDSSVSILLGNGNGTFQPQTRIAIAIGAPKRVAVADFDDDGNEDLALAIAGANRAAVYWGTGTGTGFDGTYTAVGTPGNPGGVGGADLGYGYDQLLVTNPAGTQLSVYTGDPLQRVFGAPVNTVVGNGPDAVASGNLYGETDVVVTFPSTGSLRFERGNGAGGLQTGNGGSYGVGSPPINGGQPTDVAVADVTGDGKGDMLTSNIGTTTATILPSRPSNVSSQQNTALPTGSAPTGITTGDFTGDGLADAAVVGSGTGTVTVLKGGAPGVLAPMTIVGTYPAGTAVARAESADFNGDGAADLAVSSVNDGGEVHILMSRGAPTLAGQASGSVEVGDDLTDTATLAGATPNATGTITFLLYGPGDTTCSSPTGNVTAIVSGNGQYSTSGLPIPAGSAGTYRWVASYSGDANNDAVVGTCSDANQTTVVTKKTTSVSVSPTASITVGGSATSQATLSGGQTPTGTIVVRAYAASDCSGSPAYTSNNASVGGNGTSSMSPAFTPTSAGVYSWRASYSGDANNEAATSACGASGSKTTVGKKTPTLSAAAASPVTVGTTSTVGAALASGYSPTGTITFSAYTASDCTGTAAWSSTATASGNAAVTPTTPFVPTAVGTYRVVASYGGDGNNQTAATTCGASGTVVTVDKASTTLSVTAASPITVGSSSALHATLGGGYGTLDGLLSFHAFATTDCSGLIAYTSSVAVSGTGAYAPSTPFTPSAAGTYRVVAAYSGDGNNEPVATESCADAAVVTVDKATPSLSVDVPASIALGDDDPAEATLSGLYQGTGSVTFRAYTTADCSGAPVYTSGAVTVAGNGDYDATPTFTPDHAGTYRWVATYSGDANNEAASTTCGAAGSTTAVAPFAPALAGSATSATLGAAVHDTVTLTGATSDAGGTLVFTAYANAECSGTPAFTSDPVTVDGNGDYGSGDFTPAATGQYRWVATYSGDNDNAPVETDCGADGQTSTVTQPGLAASPDGVDLGSVVTGQTSAQRTVTVTNTSSGVTAEAAKVGTVAASGAGFAVTADGCSGTTVAPGASCTFAVTFAPSAVGAASGSVAVPSNAPGSPAKVALSGTGTSPAPPPSVKLTDITVTRCMGTAKGAKKAVTVGYAVSAPSTVRFTLQRRVKPAPGVRSACPKALPAAVPGDYVDVLRAGTAARATARTTATAAGSATRALTKTVSVGAGKHTFALKGLLGTATLKPGRFRVLIQVTSDQGAKAQNAAYFWVLEPAKKIAKKKRRA